MTNHGPIIYPSLREVHKRRPRPPIPRAPGWRQREAEALLKELLRRREEAKAGAT